MYLLRAMRSAGTTAPYYCAVSSLTVSSLVLSLSFTLISQPLAAQSPICSSSASDPDGDGWGWENQASCIVTAGSDSSAAATSVITPGVAPPPVAAATPGFSNGNPICLTDASDAGNNGFCLLYTSPSPRDGLLSRMPSSA